MKRWTISELDRTSNMAFAARILRERVSGLNIYLPLSQKIFQAAGELESIEQDRMRRPNNFASVRRMQEIAYNAIDSYGKLLNGRALYDCLAGNLKMSDNEILAAGFTTLKEFMEDRQNG